nr:polymorphic toxin-type HINT domain-containing protein [Leptospira abararensis]
MGLSFNQKEGFSASLGFDGVNALSYNQNTGLSGNTNFGLDLRKKYIQDEIDEEVKLNKEAADKKLEDAKEEWLKEKRKDPKYADIKDDDELLRQYKKEQETKAAQDGSRDSLLAKIGGDIYDDVAGALGISTSDAGRLDKDGKFVPRTCFTAGTKVHTNDGLKNIEDIQVGDMVLSWNEKTGEREYKVVTELFLHEINQLYEVKTTKGTTLETTWNHPFWVVDKKAWVEVKDLQVGDVLSLADGALVEISNIRSYNVEPTKVYNFEVEDNHSYFVGEDGVLVHNYFDLAVEVVSISLDIADFAEAYKKGDTTGMLLSGGSLVVDGVLAVVPGVPGGVGIARKVAKETAEKVAKETAEKGVKKTVKETEKKAAKKSEKTFQTYTKKNETTGEVYSGRTSGKGTPEENIAKRDKNHHKNDKGFGPAKLDKSSKNSDAIRGREQQLIDGNGGAKSQKGTSGNDINGVRDKNPKKGQYQEANCKEFKDC